MGLDCAHESGVQAIVGVHQRRRMPREKQVVVDKVDENVSDNLANVHPADHLLKCLLARIDALPVALVVVRRDLKHLALCGESDYHPVQLYMC